MKNNKMKRLFAAFAGIGLCLAMLPAAFAAEYGQPDITAQTTMKQIRENPSIAGSGILTCCKEGDVYDAQVREKYENMTLTEYIDSGEDCAEALNMAIENYNRGVQVTWQVYTPEEIEQTPSRAAVQLFWFPSEQPNAKYAVVLGGNGFGSTGELREGYPTAAWLHKLGYTVFVLRYSTGYNRINNAPLEDLGRAVQFITENAGQFDVQTENYALFGFSCGGQIAGLFASEKDYGYQAYNIPKPGAVVLAYSINDFSVAKLWYHDTLEPDSRDWRYYWTNIADVIDDGYPPVFTWYGQIDVFRPVIQSGLFSSKVADALRQHNVPYEFKIYPAVQHGVSTGRGTSAEGWLTEAAAFWEEQCK